MLSDIDIILLTKKIHFNGLFLFDTRYYNIKKLISNIKYISRYTISRSTKK